MSKIKLYKGDCLPIMDKLIAEGVRVDAVITDIPYGTTACSWDSVIPFKDMWDRCNKIVKSDSSPIILFGAEPFTSELIHSNIKNFKYKWYYKKLIASNFASAKYQPMKHIEDVCVFTRSGKTAAYYPIKEERKGGGLQRIKAGFKYDSEKGGDCMNNIKRTTSNNNFDDLKYPENVREFNNRAAGQRGFHPTQKPEGLMEYLIKSHTKEGELVLDFTMGSGTTGVSCKKLNRDFIGIELKEKYCKIAMERIKKIGEC